MGIEPVPDEPAATVETDGQRLLVIADYHAGIESVLSADGIELDSRAPDRRETVLTLLDEFGADRLVVLGDLVHTIGDPWTRERTEVEMLVEALDVPLTLVKGNHDGVIESVLEEFGDAVEITPTDGIRIGNVGFAHGHTWPREAVLEAPLVCIGHEHPVVRLEDDVGGYRMERVWLRGDLHPPAFEAITDRIDGELVVFPAFNDLSGGTWINVRGQEFLSPFLPDGIRNGQAYLLDGTRLGTYRDI